MMSTMNPFFSNSSDRKVNTPVIAMEVDRYLMVNTGCLTVNTPVVAMEVDRYLSVNTPVIAMKVDHYLMVKLAISRSTLRSLQWRLTAVRPAGDADVEVPLP